MPVVIDHYIFLIDLHAQIIDIYRGTRLRWWELSIKKILITKVTIREHRHAPTCTALLISNYRAVWCYMYYRLLCIVLNVLDIDTKLKAERMKPTFLRQVGFARRAIPNGKTPDRARLLDDVWGVRHVTHTFTYSGQIKESNRSDHKLLIYRLWTWPMAHLVHIRINEWPRSVGKTFHIWRRQP